MNQFPHIPEDREEGLRWQYTRKARHLLEGEWTDILLEHMGEQVSAQRLRMVGKPMTSINLFQSIVQQLAIQYYNPLTIQHTDMSDEQQAGLQNLLEAVSLNSFQKKNSKYVVGLRESFICIKLTEKNGKNIMSLEIATPDTVICETDVTGELVYFKRAIYVPLENKWIAAWEEYSLKGVLPTYKVIRYTSKKEDITHKLYPEGFLGIKEYPFYNEEGYAFIPVTKYRAEYTNDEFNPYHFNSIISGTLDIAANWTNWNRGLRDASWPQRYLINAQPAGLSNTHTGKDAPLNVATVPTDPTSILVFESEEGKQVAVGQYQPGTNPKEAAESIQIFQSSVVNMAGIHAEDIQSTQSSSGIAISLKRSSQRRLAHQYLEEFRKADLDLLYKLVTVYNEYVNESANLPSTGYTLQYNLPKESPEEIQAEVNSQLAVINAGLASKVDVYMSMHPGMSMEDAEKHLDRIYEQNAKYK